MNIEEFEQFKDLQRKKNETTARLFQLMESDGDV